MRFLLPSSLIVVLGLFVLSPIKAEHNPIVPDEEWTPEAQLWTARGLFGEAGFAYQDVQILNIVKRRQDAYNATQERDCKRAGIPVKECPRMTFAETFKAYSFAIKPGHDKVLQRMLRRARAEKRRAKKNVEELTRSGASPATLEKAQKTLQQRIRYASNLRKRLHRWQRVHEMPWGDYENWPSHYNKEKCNKRWAIIRSLVVRWNNREIRDACPNTWHWGGRDLDPIHSGYKEQPCYNTAGGLLPQKMETVNALLSRTKARRYRKGGTVRASDVKKAFGSPLLTLQ